MVQIWALAKKNSFSCGCEAFHFAPAVICVRSRFSSVLKKRREGAAPTTVNAAPRIGFSLQVRALIHGHSHIIWILRGKRGGLCIIAAAEEFLKPHV